MKDVCNYLVVHQLHRVSRLSPRDLRRRNVSTKMRQKIKGN
jgi:hypothetical protein